MRLTVGSRRSRLARAQTQAVVEALRALDPALVVDVVEIVTEGDVRTEPLPEIGGKGLFTAALEERLRDGAIDLAVHSLKDLPTELPEGFVVAAVLPRLSARDALVAVGGARLWELPPGARVGTSSLRRQALLRHLRPDLEVVPVRGNLDTRLAKVGRELDAVVVAEAGILRLRPDGVTYVPLPPETFVPAPGQGTVAVEATTATARRLERWLRALDDRATRAATAAERAFLAGLGSGCQAPVGAYARLDGDRVRLTAFAAHPRGEPFMTVETTGADAAAEAVRQLMAAGAGRFLGRPD
jgi:hydroxymethylbilane synthase